MAEKTILFVPNTLKKRGYGHFRRCVQAARDIGPSASIYFPLASQPGGASFTETALRETAQGVNCVHTLSPGQSFDLIVIDGQSTSRPLLTELEPHGRHLVGWDEGGPARRYLPYVFDTLPNLKADAPNREAPEFLDLGAGSPFKNQPISQVLVTFGGGDPQELTHRTLHFLHKNHFFGAPDDPWEVSVVEGPLFSRPVRYPGVNILRSPSSIQALLPGFDLVICSFGITALEALRAGLPVLLLNPTGYHDRLARRYQIPCFGVRRPQLRAFSDHLLNLRTNHQAASRHLPDHQAAVSVFLREFTGGTGHCPICHSRPNPVLHRTTHKTFFRCRNCHLTYMTAHNLPPTEYSEEYFFEAYEKQYGKTYLADFDHIKALGRERLAVLAQLGGRPGQRLLDAGCAYGPFLAAAQAAGYQPIGADISAGAVAYVRQTLGLPAVLKGLAELTIDDLPGGTPDIITLWYVIEHFENLAEILTNLNRLLTKGGLLAFSTPNFQGITGLFNRKKFFQDSPDDHFSLWTPRTAGRLLRRFGFQVQKIRITGQHPERFPGLKKTSGLRFQLVRRLSLWLGWGDTFEVYARKVKEI